MNTRIYKGYAIKLVGTKYYIYAPGYSFEDNNRYFAIAGDILEAKSWVDQDIKELSN